VGGSGTYLGKGGGEGGKCWSTCLGVVLWFGVHGKGKEGRGVEGRAIGRAILHPAHMLISGS